MTRPVWPPAGPSTGGSLRIPAREQAEIIITTTVLFAAILTFGSDRNDFALFFSGLMALLVVALLASEEWARSAIVIRGRQLFIPIVLFGTSCLAIAWAGTPFGPNGSHPIWTYVQTLPAISVDRSAIFVGLAKLGGLACTFLLGWVICSSDNRARYLFRSLVIAASVYGLWALVANLNPSLRLGLYSTFQDHRLSGSFQSANTAGSLFGMTFVLAVCLMFGSSRQVDDGRGSLLQKISYSLIAATLLGTCLVLTVSRGAATATLASCAVLVIWEMFARDWHGIQKRNLTYGLAIAGGLLILAWSGDLLLGRYASSVKDWIDQRQVIYSVHWDAFLASPWFGYGIGSFDEVNKLLQNAINYPVLWNIRAAHNVYLQWLEEAGIAGTVPMFACLGWILARVALGTRSRRRMTTWLRGVVALSLVVMIHGWSDFSLEIPALAMLWSLLLGCGYAISLSHKSKVDALQTEPTGQAFDVKGGVGIAAMVGFSAIVSVICLTSWWEIDAPFGIRPLFLPLSAVYGFHAQELLDGSLSDQDEDNDIQAAREWTDEELLLSPARADGWLRLATIASMQGRPSADTAQLLDRSYLVAPLDPQIFTSRTRFVLEHWNGVTRSVREEALAQIRVGWQNWIQKGEILRLTKEVRNPAGHFAINLVVAELSSNSGLIGKEN
jgi:O-antigen ligase